MSENKKKDFKEDTFSVLVACSSTTRHFCMHNDAHLTSTGGSSDRVVGFHFIFFIFFVHLFVKPYLGRVHWEQCSLLLWTHSVTHSHLQAAQYNHSLICWPLSSSDKRWRSRALLKGPTVVVVMKEGQVLLSFLSPRFILLVWGYESPPLQSQARFSNLSATNALLICPSMTCLGRGFTWDTHEKTNFVTNWIWITCC